MILEGGTADAGPAGFGRNLARRLGEEVDFFPVVRTAVLDCGVSAPNDALHALGGFLQWFSMVPVAGRIGHFVMLRGDIDRIWHAAVLNTTLYRDLCETYIGSFIDHHAAPGAPECRWVLDTVDLIHSEFGAGTHPDFREWRERALRESEGISEAQRDP